MFARLWKRRFLVHPIANLQCSYSTMHTKLLRSPVLLEMLEDNSNKNLPSSKAVSFALDLLGFNHRRHSFSEVITWHLQQLESKHLELSKLSHLLKKIEKQLNYAGTERDLIRAYRELKESPLMDEFRNQRPSSESILDFIVFSNMNATIAQVLKEECDVSEKENTPAGFRL